jgi:hypothetical protein
MDEEFPWGDLTGEQKVMEGICVFHQQVTVSLSVFF